MNNDLEKDRNWAMGRARDIGQRIAELLEVSARR
jgi:hypothetical protein